MWIAKKTKSFTNFTLNYIENPLFMVITGSRMYGFHDEESDWDVYSVFVHPSVNLFGLNKPKTEFITPERMLYNRKVSVKVEEIEQVFRKLIAGNMKTFERIFSPVTTMKTDHYYSIIRLAKRLFTQRLIESYKEVIDECLGKYEDTKNVKFLIYALRSSLTVNLLLKTKQYQLKLKEIYQLYPQTILKELVDAKVNRRQFDNIDAVLIEIDKYLQEIQPLKHKLPQEPKPKDINNMNEYLIHLRMQYLLSKRQIIKFEKK